MDVGSGKLLLSGSKKMRNATRFRISFSIAILTGMRQGEILGLRWKDIDLENHKIFIRQTLAERGELKYGAKIKQVYVQFIFRIF